MLVLEDGVEISVHANAIAKHLFLVVEEGVSAEVLSEVHVLVHRRRRRRTSAVSAAVRKAPHLFVAVEREREGLRV